MTIFELAKRTADEQKSVEFAIEMGLININDQYCNKCGSKMNVERGKVRYGINGRYRCSKRTCSASKHLLKGSIFEFTLLV